MSYQRRVFRATLDAIVGRERAGVRPVMIISAEPLNERYDVVMVAPLTSRKPGRVPRLGEVIVPAGAGGLPRESLALCYQVRALDKSRLRDPYGEVVDVALQREIQVTIADCFDLTIL